MICLLFLLSSLQAGHHFVDVRSLVRIDVHIGSLSLGVTECRVCVSVVVISMGGVLEDKRK